MSRSKNLLPLSITAMAIMFVGCGGGGGSGGGSNPAPQPVAQNNAPTISSFSAEISATHSLDVTFSWSVAAYVAPELHVLLLPLPNSFYFITTLPCAI